MEYGLYADARVDIASVATAAEAAGFSHLWLYDSPLVYADTTVACTLALQATDRIVVGPGVANPLERPAPHTAQMIATLAKLAPGRAVLGLGVGNSARRSLGMRPATVDELVDHVRVVRGLLAGERVSYAEGDRTARIRFLHPEGRWIDLSASVPLWISAFGPKTRRRTAGLADGVLVRWEGADRFEAVRRDVRHAVQAAGRDPDAVAIGVVHAVQPLLESEDLDSDPLRSALGPLVVSRLRYLTANHDSADEVSEPYRDAFRAYRRYRDALEPLDRHTDNYLGYLVFTPTELERFVTPDLMREVVYTGTPRDIARLFEDMAGAGVDHVSLQMSGDLVAFSGRMARHVFPLLSPPAASSHPHAAA